MKMFLLSVITIFSVTTYANDLPVYPNCYRGTLDMNDGTVKPVFISLSKVEGNLARVYEFILGGSAHTYSGTVTSENEVSFHYENGNPDESSTYKVDMTLKFDGKRATGTYKSTDSESSSGNSEGTFALRKCHIAVIDD